MPAFLNVVGQKVREMVPAEAGGWVELYGGVLRTGVPIRFERELVATGRYLELAAFRVEPASRKQVAVLFQDITPRKRAEVALQQLNETLEARVVAALAERKLLADIVEGTNAFVQVVDPNFRWLAINGASAQEFHRIFGIMPKVGDNMLELLEDQPEHRDAIRAVWSKALAGEEFVEIGEFGDPGRDPSILRNALQLPAQWRRPADRRLPVRLRRHRTPAGAGAPARGRGSAAPGAEDGSGRPAHRRHRARLQQPAHRHHRQRWSCCRRGSARAASSEIDRYIDAAQGAARRAAA